ncbi:hypothetical protein AAFC00_000447 [Neodothiora populina]|uniref:PEBP-like protein n=1 Tax=Neodothiora populina TaxID=2781224 RepID=A0ABR3PD01_9PEZI
MPSIKHLAAWAAATSGPLMAFCQTPAGWEPTANTSIGIEFGSTAVTPAGLLLPQSLVDAGQPRVYSPAIYPSTYVFALIDVRVPRSAVETSDPTSLFPGLGADRTTRLHWWQDNVSQTNGTGDFSASSPPLADYQGPMPTLNDAPHDYILYLFDQPADWVSPAGAEEYYANPADMHRMSFNVTQLVEELGKPIAANYFTVQNENNTV